MEVLVSTQEIIFCKLEVSGASQSELLAIKPGPDPNLLWRIPSDQIRWDVFLTEDKTLFTLEGTLLQKRDLKTGEVQKQINLELIKTPISENRPWTAMERELALLQKGLDANQPDPDTKLKIQYLKGDIELRKKEWRILDNLSNEAAEPGKGSGFSTQFHVAKEGLVSIHRIQWRHRHGRVETLSSELLHYDQASLKPVGISGHVKAMHARSSRIPGQMTIQPFPMFHVYGSQEIEAMEEEEERETQLVLIASDPDKRVTLWRLELPVVIRKASTSDHFWDVMIP